MGDERRIVTCAYEWAGVCHGLVRQTRVWTDCQKTSKIQGATKNDGITSGALALTITWFLRRYSAHGSSTLTSDLSGSRIDIPFLSAHLRRAACVGAHDRSGRLTVTPAAQGNPDSNTLFVARTDESIFGDDRR